MDFNVENYLSNLSYINKDFPTLWNEILETVPKLTNKWIPSESNESDPLVDLLKELAIIADKLNYNIDKNILELFPATLTQERSAYNVYQSLGYTPDWYVSATTDLTIIYSGVVNTALPSAFSGINVGETTVTIPKFTEITNDEQSVNYVTLEDVIVQVGLVSKYTVTVIEGTINDFTINGSSQITYSNLDSQNRLYFTETNIAQNGIFVSNIQDFSDFTYTLDSNSDDDSTNLWKRVDNLNQYEAGNRVFMLGIDPVNNSVYIQFPDDIGNLIDDGLYVKYVLSSGEEGNVGRGELSAFLNDLTLPITGDDGEQLDSVTVNEQTVECKLVSSNFTINNSSSAQNGANPLDIEQMRNEYNKIVGVFDTLVTIRDYENFVYQYTYQDGSHVVSNIRVSDRSNDLYGSLPYITFNSDGNVIDSVVNLTTGGESSKTMTAFSLRLFPLQSKESIDTKEDFDDTFNVFENGDSIYANSQDQTVYEHNLSVLDSEVRGAISDSKCIAHDFVSPGKPIIIDYDLVGQIYLKASVSRTEASVIAQKVEHNLFQSLNARELEWGSMIDYGSVVDCIKSADDRIQYVALNSIEYSDPIEEPLSDTYGYNATIRTILSGNKAWADFYPYYYNYSTSAVETNNIGGIDDSGASDDNVVITGINTDVYVDNAKNATSYLVGNNETFTILVPQYNVVTEYGNYLYYIAKSSSDDAPTIVADTPTQLGSNQTIYIFQTRTDAEDAIDSGNYELYTDYTLSTGTIIKSSSDIEFYETPAQSNIVNMGSSITISVLERATGTIQPSNNITSDSDLYILYLATNSMGLRTAFRTAKATYTLMADEYLFYTDAIGAELGIVSEGTTLTLIGNNAIGTVSDENSGIYYIDSTSDVSSLVNGSKDSSYLTTWTQVSSRKLSNGEVGSQNVSYGVEIQYGLNELYAFGGDYLIKFTRSSTDGVEYDVEAFSDSFANTTGNFPKTFAPLSGGGKSLVTKIEYQLLEKDINGNYVSPNSSGWESLGKLLANDPYQYLVRNSLIIGPGLEQNVSKLPTGEVVSNLSSYTYANTSQNVSFTLSDGNVSTVACGNSVQSTSLVMYQGGLPITVSAKTNLQALYHTTSNTIVSFSNSFVSVDSFVNSESETSSVYFPGDANQVAIFPYLIADTRDVGYGVVSGGTGLQISTPDGGASTITIGSTSATALGVPVVSNKTSTFYQRSDDNDYKAVSFGTLLGSGSNVSLSTNEIYLSNFYPLQRIDSDYEINNPTDAESYFISNHPYNRYVLPRLNNYDKLIISPMSILSR